MSAKDVLTLELMINLLARCEYTLLLVSNGLSNSRVNLPDITKLKTNSSLSNSF